MKSDYKEFMMRTQYLKRMRWVPALALVLAVFLLFSASDFQGAAAQGPPGEGIVCTNGPNFTLTTKTGYIGTPDDNVVYMWGYSAGNSPFQHPSPVLCVNEGDTVTVILHNTFAEDVSITFPGQDNVLADGAPAQPQFDGSNILTSLTNVAPADGGSVTYSFTANSPGTFIYQSGTNPDKQVRMGLFGALIVRPPDGAGGETYANNRLDSQFKADTEFMVLLSEIDPYLNMAVERGEGDSFNMANYHPRYWLINGRGFPDSFAPNFASWLPNQPYGALARVEPYIEGDPRSLTRFISVGTVDLPMHPHSKSALIIGRDGRAYEGPNGEDLSFESFSIPMGPGQTWDGLFSWYDPDGYDPNDNPVTVDIPSAVDVGYGPLYSASPYLGQQGNFPVDFTTLNQCGEYYVISHVHALHKITSWGAPMTGPITFLRIDPPGGCE
jgi:FtsP/CotA-like multicopper oxidase with cupredoxin domain